MRWVSVPFLLSISTLWSTVTVVQCYYERGSGDFDGDWSSWSSWSSCTRPCGVGVNSRTRTCKASGGRCPGDDKEFKTCNIQECPPETQDPREKACKKFNRRLINGKRYRWEPYYRQDKECELNCRARGHRFYAKMGSTVVDGTPCKPDKAFHICLQSQCVEIGCDGVLGSNKRLDNCGVCGGDDSSCHVISGIFTRAKLPYGYNLITHIPLGACHINVTEIQSSNNYLAVQVRDGQYIINGNWALGYSNDYSGAGTIFKYHRPAPGDLTDREYVIAQGPINQTIDIMLLSQTDNRGIMYSYTIPMNKTSAKTHKEPDNRIKTYAPYPGNSYTSGNDVLSDSQQAEQHPSNSLTYKEAPMYIKPDTTENAQYQALQGDQQYQRDTEETEQDRYQRILEERRKRYREWLQRQQQQPQDQQQQQKSENSGYNNDNKQNTQNTVRASQTAQASNRADQNNVAQPQYRAPQSEVAQPSYRAPQSEVAQPQYRAPQSEVAQPQYRAPQSEVAQPQSQYRAPPSDIPLPPYRAPQSEVAQPSNNQGEDTPQPSSGQFAGAYYGNRYQGNSPYYQSEVQRGVNYGVQPGTPLRPSGNSPFIRYAQQPQQPVFVPQSQYGNQGFQVNPSLYDSIYSNTNSGGPARGNVGLGTLDTSATYSWKISGFTDCSRTCGGGTQETLIVCVLVASQAVVTDENCDPSNKPQSQTVVCNNRHCPPGWEASDWTPCTTSCGRGTQSRTVECKQRVSSTITISVSASRCQDDPRPDTVQLCNDDKPCVKWRVGEWSQCSADCGQGQRNREVLCVDANNNPVPENKCDTIRPRSTEVCDMGSCAKTWFFTDWTKKCSTSCGEGFYTRSLYCSAESERCSLINRPEERKLCDNQLPCGGKWFTGPWSECSATCGAGHVLRDVVCMKKVGRSVNVVGEENCLELEKPEVSMDCASEPCQPNWYMTNWTECTRPCGTGSQTREIKCLNPDQTISTACLEEERPLTRQSCNTQSCRTYYYKKTDDNGTPDCTDKYQNCALVVQARLCRYQYYKGICCQSCRQFELDHPNDNES